MADQIGSDVRIDRVTGLSIVSLKVSRNQLDSARKTLQLAKPLEVAGDDPRSLWLGPDRWLLVSDTVTADTVIVSCTRGLAGILHNAVDYSSGLAVLRVAGRRAPLLLATGTGIDLRPARFPAGTCCRTRLGQVATVIVSEAPDVFDLYVDRSYETYLTDWLAESASIYTSYAG